MAKYIKGNISYQPVVEEISRKFTTKKNTCTKGLQAGPVEIETKGWMGGAVRQTGRGGIGVVRKNYLIIRENARTTPVSRDELQNREIFTAATRGKVYILYDLTQLTRVQQMYIEASADLSKHINGVSANGYTLSGWVFAVQFAGKKEAVETGTTYDVNNFPSAFDA